MDNQFRRPRHPDYKGNRPPARPPARTSARPAGRSGRGQGGPAPPKKPDDSVIDLYDDTKKPDPGQPDPELEELKKLAQSDVLKAYAWFRRKTSDLGAKARRLKADFSQKARRRTFKLALAGLAAAVLAFSFGPGLINMLKGQSDILGQTQTVEQFDTLRPPQNSQPVVFDEEEGVAVYRDVINGVQATISQQPLPDDAEGHEGLEKVALNLPGAVSTSQLQTDKGVAYVVLTATDTNIAIFAYQELLVSVRTGGVVGNDSWIEYINSLQ